VNELVIVLNSCSSCIVRVKNVGGGVLDGESLFMVAAYSESRIGEKLLL
jgi:hypothetical protein